MNAGDRYGRYEVIRLIGRGAMGEVYLARDMESQRQIALKVVYKGPEAEDQEIVDAERLGAELQKRLSGADRRVVTVNRYGEINGDLFIEMEYIEGEDLSTILARGPVSPGFATLVAIELCEMLEKLGAFSTTIGDHQFAGIVHGDLKPRNIRLNTQNQVKALDFGIAKALSQTRKYTVNIFASTAYCSPERLETQNMDSHSDLWSVGVLLYQMLSGKLPFDEPTKERLERRIRSSAPPQPLPPSCPEPLHRVVFKMLARDPERRYQSPTETKADLERFRRGEPVGAEMPPDNDATVRTAGPERRGAAGYSDADDGTVRTTSGTGPMRPAMQPPPLPPPPPMINWPPKQMRGRNTLGCLAVFGTVCLVMIIVVLGQLSFWSEADKLQVDLQSERVTNLDDAWSRYEALAKRPHLGMFLWGAKRALKKRLFAAADEVILEYRNNDAPQVYEAQWGEAKTELSRVMELDTDDNAVKGRLRLCEGHLDRIYGDKSKNANRLKFWNTAALKFNEAAELLKKSPDPYLGLARLYTYELNDMDRAEDALKKAAEYGHPEGKRETAQLADGYRHRGDRLWKDSRALTDLPDQEHDYLIKSRQDYIHAEDLYQEIGYYGDAARNRSLALQGQQRVEERLAELSWGNVPK